MARRANVSGDNEDAEEYTGKRNSQRDSSIARLPSSPAASFSSDKENRKVSSSNSRIHKDMPTPKVPTANTGEPSTPNLNPNKRRKLRERDAPNASQVAHEKELERLGNTQYYDPDQSMEERRAVRKGLRDLSKELNGRSSHRKSKKRKLLLNLFLRFAR